MKPRQRRDSETSWQVGSRIQAACAALARSCACLAVLVLLSSGAGAQTLPESRHPYLPSATQTFRVTSASPVAPPAIDLTFDARTEFESGSDFLDVLDSTGRRSRGLRPRFEVYVPDGPSSLFTLETGKGYLASVPVGKTVSLP